MEPTLRAIVALLFVAVWQGMVGVLVKWVSWPALAMVCLRCFIASAALEAVLATRRRLASARDPERTVPVARLSRDTVLGGALLAGHWGALFWAFRIADVGPVIVAVFTYPVMISVGEPLYFGRRPESRQLLTAGLGLAGVWMLGAGATEGATGANNLLGITVALFSAAFYAARNVHARTLIGSTDALTIMAHQVMFAGVLLLPSLIWVPANSWTLRNLGLILVLGVGFTAVPHTLIVWALRWLSAAAVGILTSLQVVSGMLLAALLLDEPQPPGVWVGAATVIAAVACESAIAWRRAGKIG